MLYHFFSGIWKALTSTAHLVSYSAKHFWRSNLAWKPCGVVSASPGHSQLNGAAGKNKKVEGFCRMTLAGCGKKGQN